MLDRGEAAEAFEEFQTCAELASWFRNIRLVIAEALIGLGRAEEARAALRELLDLNPAFSVEGVKPFLSSADPASADRVVDALRKAGLPE